MKAFGILTSWNLLMVEGHYYISGTHYTYLKYASANFDKVYLISSARFALDPKGQCPVDDFKNIEVVELPAVDSYLGALKNYRHYSRAIKWVKDKIDFMYCRVPDPYCWLPRLRFGIPTVMHYVGDTIDATRRNEKWSWIKKQIMICGYLPEYLLTLVASKKSAVYTNGIHLRDKLERRGIKSTAVISSTVSQAELVQPEKFRSERIPPQMIYVGYLRFAKGMNLLKNLWLRLKENMPDFIFHIVGNGEMENDLKNFVAENELHSNIIFHGRIDDRNHLKSLLRFSDLFVFPSLSEGSPRVVIEAMAEGVPVISTPVGSLPGTFKDGEAIRYFGYDDVDEAFELISDYCHNPEIFDRQRLNAFREVQNNLTIENFLSQIYSSPKTL